MIGDSQRQIVAKYDVEWPVVRLVQRVTVVIDAQGIVRNVFHHEVRVGKHVRDVVDALRRLQGV